MEEKHIKENQPYLNSRGGFILAGAIISFLFLIILASFSYSYTAVEKQFGIKSFYTGAYGKDIDPKAQYNTIYKNTIVSANGCLNKMKQASNPMRIGSYVWIVDGQAIEDTSYFESVAVNSNLAEIKPYKDGQKIISPSDLIFLNANTIQDKLDSINIRAQIGSSYIIEFENVKSWWCHIGKDNPTKHTQVIGTGGIYSRCTAGYIIGEATNDTIVKLYSLDTNSRAVPCSFAEVFRVDEEANIIEEETLSIETDN